VTLRNLFHLQEHLRSGELPRAVILDLAGVPYMDSAGMGAIINYYVHCDHRGVKLIVAGVNHRVMELFKLTRVDKVLTLAASAEEAESGLRSGSC
jgi:anti-sigma B factor antagonist